MKNLYILGFVASIIYISSCQLDPLPYPETFETLVEPTGLVLNKLIDGVELSNGDVVVVGTAKKDIRSDLFIARIGLNGNVVDYKTFYSGDTAEINAICKDDEDELYIVGRNITKKKGIIFKISPKSNTFTQVWLKNNLDIPTCSTLKQVQFSNNVIYAVGGALDGVVCNSSVFKTFSKSSDTTICKGNYGGRIGTQASVIGNNGTLVYAGDGNINATNNLRSTLVLASCTSPKFISSNVKYETAYNNIRGMVSTTDDIIVVGNYYSTAGVNAAKSFLVKLPWNSLGTTSEFSITNPNNQIDSTKNKGSYVVVSMTSAPSGVLYAANFFYTGSDIEYTQLKRFNTVNINSSQLIDAWGAKPFLNITTSKLINSNYQNHGGYIVIGQARQKGKVIKVNREGIL